MGGTGLEERNPVVTVNKDDEKISRLKKGEGKLFFFFFRRWKERGINDAAAKRDFF